MHSRIQPDRRLTARMGLTVRPTAGRTVGLGVTEATDTGLPGATGDVD